MSAVTLACKGVPDGGFKVPGYGAGSSQKAGFHLNFEPEVRSQRLSRGLGWENTPAKATDTAGNFDPPLVTNTVRAGAFSPVLRLTLVSSSRYAAGLRWKVGVGAVLDIWLFFFLIVLRNTQVH